MRAKRPGANRNRGETTQGANGNRGETTRGGASEQDLGRNDPVPITIKSNEHKIKKSKQIAIKSLIKIVSIVFN